MTSRLLPLVTTCADLFEVMVPAWDKDHVPDASITGVHMPGSGRRPSQTAVPRLVTASLDMITKYCIDKAVIPVLDTPVDGMYVIDTTHIATTLTQSSPKYGTAVMSRDELARAYELTMHLYNLDIETPDYMSIDFRYMVGKVMPIVGPMPGKICQQSKAFDPAHSDFAMRPIVISTNGQPGVIGDQGEVVLQAITLTTRCFNFPEGDSNRVTLGMNPRFEDTIAWVLVTHAYMPCIPYGRLNKQNSKKRPREPDDPYEAVFMWDAYAQQHASRLREPGYRITRFGLADTKQTAKMLVRAMLPWSVREIGEHLHRLRRETGDHTLRDVLINEPMTNPVKTVNPMQRERGGLDLRRMLMVELLVKDTPLDPLLTGGDVVLPYAFLPCSAVDMVSRAAAYTRGRF